MDFTVNLLTWCPEQCTCARLSGADPQPFRFSEHWDQHDLNTELHSCCWDTWLFSSHLFPPFPLPSFLFPATALVGFLVPQLGTEPGPSAVRVQSPNHWACRQCPRLFSRGPLSGSTVENASVSRVKTLTLRSQMAPFDLGRQSHPPIDNPQICVSSPALDSHLLLAISTQLCTAPPARSAASK